MKSRNVPNCCNWTMGNSKHFIWSVKYPISKVQNLFQSKRGCFEHFSHSKTAISHLKRGVFHIQFSFFYYLILTWTQWVSSFVVQDVISGICWWYSVSHCHPGRLWRQNRLKLNPCKMELLFIKQCSCSVVMSSLKHYCWDSKLIPWMSFWSHSRQIKAMARGPLAQLSATEQLQSLWDTRNLQ